MHIEGEPPAVELLLLDRGHRDAVAVDGLEQVAGDELVCVPPADACDVERVVARGRDPMAALDCDVI
jgi:hypothetical protein